MTPLLLSKRKAAQLLGVGRGGTLEELIRDGHLRVVMLGAHVKVPREEVERLAREGTQPAPAPKGTKPQAPRRTRGGTLADEIRNAKIT